ncbi:MAG: hypothetical protein AAEJ52_14270 [Myxococcota bacterium]
MSGEPARAATAVARRVIRGALPEGAAAAPAADTTWIGPARQALAFGRTWARLRV